MASNIRNLGSWQKITIERATQTQDEFGSFIPSWSTWKIIYANIIPVSGREVFNSSRQNVIKSSRFFIYYLEGLTEKDRILYNGDIYDISYIASRGMSLRETMEILGEVQK
jgi:SPP1 family predicted phage head-tail adaptor